jgi:hypothetical protein
MNDDYKASPDQLKAMLATELELQRKERAASQRTGLLPAFLGAAVGAGSVGLPKLVMHPDSTVPLDSVVGGALFAAGSAAMILLPLVAIAATAAYALKGRGLWWRTFGLAGTATMLGMLLVR